MIFDSKDATVEYINKLLDNSIEIDFERLNFMLESNGIKINNILFEEDSQKDEFLLNSIKINSDKSVDLSINCYSWNNYLPSIYQDNDFLKRFLFGLQVTNINHKEYLDNIDKLFKPEDTKFIDWLSTWFGVKYHNVISDNKKRRLLSHMIELYKCRGTKKYFKGLIKILTDVEVEIEENIYHSSNINHNKTQKTKNSFNVVIKEKISLNKEKEKETLKIIKTIIDTEKPVNVDSEIIYSYIKEDVHETGKEVYEEAIVDFHATYESGSYDY
jgi:phage tail-like protein